MSQQEEKKFSQQPDEAEIAGEEEVSQEEATILEEEPKERYVPRPKWQLAFAWVLVAVMVAAIISYYYWIVYPYG